MNQFRTSSLRITVVTGFCIALAAGVSAQPIDGSVPSHSRSSIKPLPKALASVLAEVKSKTRIAILLPDELPNNFAAAKYPTVDEASESTYAVSMYYELGVGDAGFAAHFEAHAHANFQPKDIGNVSEVKLSHGLVGYFRPVNCGGSCAPANLWWKENQVVYLIHLKLSSTEPESAQERAITRAANSAILAGPR
jgi:hypothetical protein